MHTCKQQGKARQARIIPHPPQKPVPRSARRKMEKPRELLSSSAVCARTASRWRRYGGCWLQSAVSSQHSVPHRIRFSSKRLQTVSSKTVQESFECWPSEIPSVAALSPIAVPMCRSGLLTKPVADVTAWPCRERQRRPLLHPRQMSCATHTRVRVSTSTRSLLLTSKLNLSAVR
jgi:transposase